MEKIKLCNTEEAKLYMEELYYNNLGLMKKATKPFLYYAEESELLNICFLGLSDAVIHYENRKGAFASYAVYWYRQAITKFLADGGFTVRIPPYFRDKIRRYKDGRLELANYLGHEPSDWEMAEYLGLDYAELLDIKLYAQNITSLDAPITDYEGNEMSLSDTLASDFSLEETAVEEVYKEHEKTALWGICERYMSDSEYGIIEDFYKNSKSQTEIADELNLSHQRVRQIHQKALEKMRKGAARKELLEELEVADAKIYSTGFKNFKLYGESKVEYLARKRMEIERKMSK